MIDCRRVQRWEICRWCRVWTWLAFERLDVVERAQDVRARVAVLHAVEGHRLPLGEHLVERLLERELLRRRVRRPRFGGCSGPMAVHRC